MDVWPLQSSKMQDSGSCLNLLGLLWLHLLDSRVARPAESRIDCSTANRHDLTTG